jgi:uncharacterized protein (TIGR02466 family)
MTLDILQARLFNKSNVGTDSEYNNLLAQVNAIRNDPNADKTNDLCWRSFHKFQNIDWLLSEINVMVWESVNHYSKGDQVFKQLVQDKKYSVHYWTNINAPMSRNIMHSHTSASLSCVYYLQGSSTGALRLINPANMLANCHEKSPYTRDFYFAPTDKDLIMWPSWIPHEVEPNLSNKERINITFDITFL